ncbi:hypothetical protein BH11PSE1_BH11PSE1_10540 [soil metagenome]
MIDWQKSRRRRRPTLAQVREVAWVLLAAILLVAIHAACDAFGVQAP